MKQFITVFGFLFSIVFGQFTKYTVAVMDLVPRGINERDAFNLTNVFYKELDATQQMYLMEREQMSAVLEKRGFQLGGCTSLECAVRAGNLLGVQQVIIGYVMNEVGKYTVEVSAISVAHRKALKNKKIEYRGNPDDLGMEVQLLAYKLLDRYPPDHLTRKKEVQVKVQSVSAAKSNTDAMKKSLMFPGGGQLYIGRKTSAFTFMGLEAFMVLMAINSQASYKKYENERSDVAELYRQATTPDDINRYRSEIISIDSKMNSANSNVGLFLGGFLAIWVANVVHAYVMEPVLPDYSSSPLRLAYDPLARETKLTWRMDI